MTQYPTHLIDAIIAITDADTCKKIIDLSDKLKEETKSYYEWFSYQKFPKLSEIWIAICRIEGYQKGSNEGLLKRLEAIEASLDRLETKRAKKGNPVTSSLTNSQYDDLLKIGRGK